MKFAPPVTFREALALHRRRRVRPTTLSSADLSRIDDSILRASFFSARTAMVDLLRQYKADIEKLIAPRLVKRPDRITPENPEGWVPVGTTDAEIREGIKSLLDRMDYKPEAGKEGTIEDLSSDQRIDLVIRVNTEMAQNHGWWEQGQDPDLLDAFPAQELYRAEDRKVKRSWIQRWRAAGGKVYAGTSPGLPIEPGFSEGRLVARKDDPVWASISRFGNPYPPFDFNSGLDVREVDYPEAVALGVMQSGDQVKPRPVRFGESLTDADLSVL